MPWTLNRTLTSLYPKKSYFLLWCQFDLQLNSFRGDQFSGHSELGNMNWKHCHFRNKHLIGNIDIYLEISISTWFFQVGRKSFKLETKFLPGYLLWIKLITNLCFCFQISIYISKSKLNIPRSKWCFEVQCNVSKLQRKSPQVSSILDN